MRLCASGRYSILVAAVSITSLSSMMRYHIRRGDARSGNRKSDIAVFARLPQPFRSKHADPRQEQQHNGQLEGDGHREHDIKKEPLNVRAGRPRLGITQDGHICKQEFAAEADGSDSMVPLRKTGALRRDGERAVCIWNRLLLEIPVWEMRRPALR